MKNPCEEFFDGNTSRADDKRMNGVKLFLSSFAVVILNSPDYRAYRFAKFSKVFYKILKSILQNSQKCPSVDSLYGAVINHSTSASSACLELKKLEEVKGS